MSEYTISKSIRKDKPIKKNGKYPIDLRVRVRDKGIRFSTGFDVRPDDWDDKHKEIKEKSLRLILDKQIFKLELAIHNAILEGKELSTNLVRSLYKGKEGTKPEQRSFYEYYLSYVERRRKEGLNKETIRVYLTTYNVLKAFRDKVRICDVTLDFIEKFDAYMRDVNGNSAGGRNPKHKNIRTVLLDIEKHRIPIENPYKWFKIAQSNAREVYLNKDELQKLRDATLPLEKDSTDYNVLQMYQFSCFCGLRFSDTLDLEWKDIDFENGIIRKTMIKTKNEVITPIFPLAKHILEERLKVTKGIGKVFKWFAEPTFNKALRKYAKLIGIDKHITYHSSRHTFATLLVIDNVDIYKISKYLGHKSVDMTQRYLKYNLSIAKELAKDIETFSS